MFFIISLRNQPLLGLWILLGSGPSGNPPSPALASAASCTCFFSLGGGVGGWGHGFPLWPSPSGSPLCHVAASPLGFPLSWWDLLKSVPTWSAQDRRVPFKDSQIESQKLIKTKFHSFLVPLEDARRAQFIVLATSSDSFLSQRSTLSTLPPKRPPGPPALLPTLRHTVSPPFSFQWTESLPGSCRQRSPCFCITRNPGSQGVGGQGPSAKAVGRGQGRGRSSDRSRTGRLWGEEDAIRPGSEDRPCSALEVAQVSHPPHAEAG